MSYVNKAVVNGQEVQLNSLEGLQDAEGHNRFVEGNLTPNEIAGVTYKYAKWSLSGSHLMIVLAGTIDNGTTIGNAITLANLNLPEWIFNKIYPAGEGSIADIISYNDFNLIGISSYDRVNEQFYLVKTSNNYYLDIRKSGALTATQDLYFRVQFDLVIDNA